MILQYILASAAIFTVLAAWLSIDHWARQSGLPHTYNCSEDETHCHHCEMADNCMQRHDH
jgi:hypothetical protein